jgi:glycine rich protein
MRYIGLAREAARTLLIVCMALAGTALTPGVAAADVWALDYTGGSQTFVVPSGVEGIAVSVEGASGSDPNGGLGQVVRAILPVTPGESLTVNVGGRGQLGSNASGGAGGFNGGGAGGDGHPSGSGSDRGGGGGASDLRRGATKLIVAGGGGGGPFGGNAGQDARGHFLPNFQSCFQGSGGGRAGTASSGGAGGTAGAFSTPGSPGSAGQGGAGGSSTTNTNCGAGSGGAGGGGGYFGGGGGGGGNNGGGGGGSSFVASSATASDKAAFADPGHGSVTIVSLSASDGGECSPGQVGKPPACVDEPGGPGIEDQYSQTCRDSNAKNVDGFSGSTYVLLRVQQNPDNAQETWACYRAWNATGSIDVGGRVDFDPSGAPGLPVLEPDSSGCSVTPVDLTVGPDETPLLVGVNSAPSEARACLRVGTFEQSVKVPVPGGVGGVPVVNQDAPDVPDPEERQGPAGYPSSTCQNTPGHTRLANLESGSTWIAAYSAPGGPGETRLCVRGQGPVSAGGMLTLKSTTGVSPVVQGPVADTAPSSCTTNVLANGSDPARFSIRVTAANPASLCLSAGSSGPFAAPGQRFTLGTSGSPVVPVVWTPDPGTPG